MHTRNTFSSDFFLLLHNVVFVMLYNYRCHKVRVIKLNDHLIRYIIRTNKLLHLFLYFVLLSRRVSLNIM